MEYKTYVLELTEVDDTLWSCQISDSNGEAFEYIESDSEESVVTIAKDIIDEYVEGE